MLLLVLSLLTGLAFQLLPGDDRIRAFVWLLYFWTVTPVLVFVTFLTFRLDERLLLGLAAAILATWLVASVGYAYAALVTSERDERGALALAVGFPNTGFLGLPIAQLAFGEAGLALAVLYNRLAWLVPDTSVSTVIARLHGRRKVDVLGNRRASAVLANPPLAAMLVALLFRAAGLDVPFTSEGWAGASAVVGPAGFFLLGLSLPLERLPHRRAEIGRAAGAFALRFGGGPLALFAVGRLLDAVIPPAFYVLAAMPCAFHLLILARVYDLRPALMRLLVVGSTVAALAAVALAAALG